MKALYNTCIANKENATNNINVLFYTDGSSCCNKSVFEDETDSIEYLDKLIDNDCNLINFSAIGFGNYVSEEYLYKLVNKSQFGRYIYYLIILKIILYSLHLTIILLKKQLMIH